MYQTTQEALDGAIDHFGGPGALATALSVRPSVVSNWRSRGRCSVKAAIDIDRLTKQKVTKEALRPDMFEG